jgi:hypothetical protein
VVLWLVDKSILKRGNTFGHDNCHGEGIIEGRDVTEGHNTGESTVAFRLTDIVNGSSGTTRVDNKLSKLSSLLGDLTDACGSILADLHINVFEAV